MNNILRPINWAMLTHHAKGTLDGNGQQELEQWLQQNPDHKLILEEVVAIYEKDRWLDSTEKYKHFKTEPALQKFMQQLSVEKPVVRKVWSMFRVSAAAAGILFLLGISYFLIHWNSRNINTVHKDGLAAAGMQWKKAISAPGHVLNVTLADGSVVRLAPGSTLQYPQSFGTRERLVRLEGEAFFEVTKDPDHPFIVQTREISTRVLGTSFNIEAYGYQLFSTVTLITGKVSIGRMQGEDPDSVLAVLVPNERITVSHEDTTFTVSKIGADNAEAIRNGKLIFDSETMKDVARKLELHYGIKVYLENTAVESIAFTGTFDHIALDKLTGMIAETTGLRMELKGDNLYISNPKTK